MEGSVLMVYVFGMLPIVLNDLRKAHLRAMMSWAAAMHEMAVSARLDLGDLRAALGCFLLGMEGFGRFEG